MKKVSKEVLKDAANRLMFDMSDEQYNILLDEFDVITKQLELMGEIEGIDKEDVMTFPFNCEVDLLREDEAATALTQDEVLSNAGSIKDGQIKLPKVIG
jgi:aspartyl/glutamyl-tRNA(Asn/Gln) amidotransferase C subunit